MSSLVAGQPTPEQEARVAGGVGGMTRLLLLFALSGTAGLIYEVVWFQLLRLTVGSSAQSLGILIACFMGGLFIGSASVRASCAASLASTTHVRDARIGHRGPGSGHALPGARCAVVLSGPRRLTANRPGPALPDQRGLAVAAHDSHGRDAPRSVPLGAIGRTADGSHRAVVRRQRHRCGGRHVRGGAGLAADAGHARCEPHRGRLEPAGGDSRIHHAVQLCAA